jgi:hypothetical protein
VTVPYRVVLGARPFIDETGVSQSAGLIEVPFIWIYHSVFRLAGIMLFERHLHFLVSMIVSGCVFLGIRPFARSTAEALLPSLLPIVFVPFNLPDLSYNTIASGFFTAGCFLALRSVASDKRGFIAAAGLAQGLAICAYPTFVAPALILGVVLAIVERNALRRVVALYTRWRPTSSDRSSGGCRRCGLANTRHAYATARQA